MKILVLVAEGRDLERLSAAVRAAGHEVVAELKSVIHLRHASDASDPDLILVHADFLDDSMLQHLAELNAGKMRPIAVFTRDSQHIRDAVRAGVSAYVVNGFSEERLNPIFELAVARFNEDQATWRELSQMKDKLSDRKVVERAKGILMETGMSEESAYQALRKEAMNKNLRLAEVAGHVVALGKLFTPSKAKLAGLQRR